MGLTSLFYGLAGQRPVAEFITGLPLPEAEPRVRFPYPHHGYRKLLSPLYLIGKGAGSSEASHPRVFV